LAKWFQKRRFLKIGQSETRMVYADLFTNLAATDNSCL
jgi:hypothetical protein